MTATIIDGNGIAAAVRTGVRTQVEALGVSLHLAAVCVGSDPGIRAFVDLKRKAAQTAGIEFSAYLFDGTDRQAVAETLRYLAADDDVQGIFVELPLPADWNRDELLALIPPAKDVDALTSAALVPAPAVRALGYVLHEHGIAVAGIRAVVVGDGFLVGRPVAAWLRSQGAVVDVLDVGAPSPADTAGAADLIVAGAGVPGLVTGEWVREGAVVVDYGYAKQGDRYVGDVDDTSVRKKAGVLTPVPGGMGPLVIAAVLENLVELATR